MRMASATTGVEGMLTSLPCKEFSEFKEAVQQMRAIDDRIIYKLNTSVPTISFANEVSARDQCKELYEQLRAVHNTRSSAIQQCISETTETVRELKERRDAGTEDPLVTKELRKQQTKLRLMNSELVVEDVVRDRSMKMLSRSFGEELEGNPGMILYMRWCHRNQKDARQRLMIQEDTQSSNTITVALSHMHNPPSFPSKAVFRERCWKAYKPPDM